MNGVKAPLAIVFHVEAIPGGVSESVSSNRSSLKHIGNALANYLVKSSAQKRKFERPVNEANCGYPFKARTYHLLTNLLVL